MGSEEEVMETVMSALLLLGLFINSCLGCGPLSIKSGNAFCNGRSCSHIYNFKPCSFYNPSNCVCAASVAKCDAGYTLEAGGTKCYIARTGQTGWADANNLCLANGDLRLATITSSTQNDAVKTLAAAKDAYIGLSDTATEGTFLWNDGSTTAAYSNPSTNFNQAATSANQDCVKIKADGTWDDIGCHKGTADVNFICEKKPT